MIRLRYAGQPFNTNTVAIGGKTYTFQTTLTDVNGNVKIGANVLISYQNLVAAINMGPGGGTAYALSTTLNPVYGATTVLLAPYTPLTATGTTAAFVDAVTAIAADSDPPFPPVWPYLFSTNVLYGRENLTQNLKMFRKNDYIFDITVLLDGAVVDLTGSTLTLTAKWAVKNSTNVFKLDSNGDGIVIDSGTGGTATITIPSADTVNLPAHELRLPYDIELVDSTGGRFTVAYGTITVVPQVTTA